MPSKRYTFRRSSILFRPQNTACYSGLLLVEAPGTAPGSDTLITCSFIAIAGATGTCIIVFLIS